MADFVGNIWLSIFTAGPTPTLMVATNVAFGALQLVLAGLLFATYSVHFVVLSFLCGGLWWSINWFAHEVSAIQAEQAAKKTGQRGSGDADAGSALDDHSGMDTGDETDETETGRSQLSERDAPTASTGASRFPEAGGAAPQESSSSTASLLTPASANAVKKRRTVTESPGELSTDSEWEKVSN